MKFALTHGESDAFHHYCDGTEKGLNEEIDDEIGMSKSILVFLIEGLQPGLISVYALQRSNVKAKARPKIEPENQFNDHDYPQLKKGPVAFIVGR